MIASLYQRGSVALASFFTLWFSNLIGCTISRSPPWRGEDSQFPGGRPGPWLGMPWKFISEELRPAGVPFGLAPSYNLHAGPAANSVVAQGADEGRDMF